MKQKQTFSIKKEHSHVTSFIITILYRGRMSYDFIGIEYMRFHVLCLSICITLDETNGRTKHQALV